MSHLVLLGDSIFDNASYVAGRPAVIDQVRSRLPRGWHATLNARDGSVINDVHRQIERLPDDASHLVVSVGGNDALREIGVLQKAVSTVGDALHVLSEIGQRFETDYQRLLQAIHTLGLPTILCTIYNPCSPDEHGQITAVTALSLFNDWILQSARKSRHPIIDLRAVCTDASDYANPIEPSSSGGAKMAQSICEVVLTHDFTRHHSTLFP